MSKKLSTIKTELSLITLAQQNGIQFLLASKNQKAADRMLMLMLAQHGMQVLTPFSSKHSANRSGFGATETKRAKQI